MPKLSDDALRQLLAERPEWSVAQGMLVKTFSFASFGEAIAFVNRVARLAEDADHHPDIDIRYSDVTLRLATHSEGGITEKDAALAGAADQHATG